MTSFLFTLIFKITLPFGCNRRTLLGGVLGKRNVIKGCDMYISDLDADKLSDDQMTKLLFSDIQDDGQQGDCIFVAGSRKAVL